MDVTSSSEDHSEDSEAPPPKKPPPIPPELSWIQKGVPTLVSWGIGGLYNARALENPSFSEEMQKWVVKVKWDSWNTVDTVECSCCVQVVDLDDDEGMQGRRLRNREPISPPKALDASPATVVSMDSDTSSVSDKKKSAALRKAKLSAKLLDDAKKSLCQMPNVSPDEAEEALRVVGYPYGLQGAMQEIQQMRSEAMRVSNPGTFQPKVGTKIRKPFDGKDHYGEIKEEVEEPAWNAKKRKHVKVWTVLYEDGDMEDMEWGELLRYRIDRSNIPALCRGRQLQCLELFCGKGIVSQEFCERKWQVISIDSDENSNATMKSDIRDINPEELGFVPDFIWASPPCHTYSKLAGSIHRDVAAGKFDKTEEARQHNFLFQKMTEFMVWAEKRHKHLIVAIENPVGKLQNMPLMAEFVKTFHLHSTTVDYCAFGRDEKKPTMIWTNDWGLSSTLSEFQCKTKCPVGLSRGTHAVAVRDDSHLYDFSVIPQALAEEVADYVHAKFTLDRIRKKKAASPRD